MRSRIGTALALSCALAQAQQLLITSPQPVTPGAPYAAQIFNNTGGSLCLPSLPMFVLLQPLGELLPRIC